MEHHASQLVTQDRGFSHAQAGGQHGQGTAYTSPRGVVQEAALAAVQGAVFISLAGACFGEVAS